MGEAGTAEQLQLPGSVTSLLDPPETSRLQAHEKPPLEAMEGYCSAVQKMEQTVLFPSLLREVFLEEHNGRLEALGDRDLYESYTLLKSIKQMAEGGLLSLNTQILPVVTGLKDREGQEEADLEGLFYYHVSGLYRVLTRLTERAKMVTSRYNQIMGQINHGEMSLSW